MFYFGYTIDMTPLWKISTENLTKKLLKSPNDINILNELNKRAKRVFKCQLRAQLYMEKQREKYNSKLMFGHKDEAYATEEEMLNGFTCDVSELSEIEMLIYNGI